MLNISWKWAHETGPKCFQTNFEFIFNYFTRPSIWGIHLLPLTLTHNTTLNTDTVLTVAILNLNVKFVFEKWIFHVLQFWFVDLLALSPTIKITKYVTKMHWVTAFIQESGSWFAYNSSSFFEVLDGHLGNVKMSTHYIVNSFQSFSWHISDKSILE